MAKNAITFTVSIGDRKVTLEGPEDFVRAEVQRLTNALLPDAPRHDEVAAPATGASHIRSERDAIAQKCPKNQSEIVTVLGFFLTENGHAEFTEADIKRAYLRAGQRPPKVISQALRDAKNNFDFLESGSKRGTYKLSTHGDRTVRFDLPRKEA